MENSLVYKICKWIVASSTGLIAIPLALLILIFSLYPSNFKEFPGDFKLFRFESYYKLFDSLKNKKEVNISNINVTYDTITKYCHLLVIDRTLSTKDKDVNLKDSLKDFSDHLQNKLFSFNNNGEDIIIFNKEEVRKNVYDSNSKSNSKDSLAIKDYVILRFFQKLVSDKLSDGIMLAFFDGKNVTTADLENKWDPRYTTTKDLPKFYSIGDEKSRRRRIEALSKAGFLVYEKNQTSDFKILFNEINNLCNNKWIKDSNKIILTIISDFDHDVQPKIPVRLIEEFKKNNNYKVAQYNLIYFPSSISNSKERSKELLNNIITQIEGLDNLIEIDLQEYVYFDDDLKHIFENKLLKCLAPVQTVKEDSKKEDSKKENIIFYYPKENSQNIRTANAKVKITKDNNHQPFEWRISTVFTQETDNKLFISYGLNQRTSKKSRYIVNGGWNKLKAKDSVLFLEMEFNDCNCTDISRYYFEIKHDKDNFGKHKIILQECFSEETAGFAIKILNILCIIISLIVISGTILVITKNRKTPPKKPYLFLKIMDNLILFIILIFVFCMCHGKYMFLLISSIVIIICIITLLWYLFLKNRWVSFLKKMRQNEA